MYHQVPGACTLFCSLINRLVIVSIIYITVSPNGFTEDWARHLNTQTQQETVLPPKSLQSKQTILARGGRRAVLFPVLQSGDGGTERSRVRFPKEHSQQTTVGVRFPKDLKLSEALNQSGQTFRTCSSSHCFGWGESRLEIVNMGISPANSHIYENCFSTATRTESGIILI